MQNWKMHVNVRDCFNPGIHVDDETEDKILKEIKINTSHIVAAKSSFALVRHFLVLLFQSTRPIRSAA